jgi:arylamine N-acetyltransferase
MPTPTPVLALLRELSALPYENLSKIVAWHQGAGADFRKVEKALSLSGDWVDKSRETGAGGTCFSLTWWLARRLREAGYASGFLLADKGKAEALHCGLRVEWEGRAYLLDPGYMIFDPLPLPEGGLVATLWSSPNEVHLEDTVTARGRIWRLSSGPRGAPKWRFDFRREPASEADFLAAWEASYRFPMMGYPVLNRIVDGTQYYLQKRSLLVRKPDGSEMRKLGREEMLEALGRHFGIPEGLSREALDIVLGADQAFFLK